MRTSHRIGPMTLSRTTEANFDENTRVFIETKIRGPGVGGNDQIPLVDVDGAKKDGWRDVCDSLEEGIVTGDDGIFRHGVVGSEHQGTGNADGVHHIRRLVGHIRQAEVRHHNFLSSHRKPVEARRADQAQ